MRVKHIWLLLLGVILLTLAASGSAWAQASDNSLDRIVDLFRSNARNWEMTLGRFALSLFWLLAGIEFVVAAIMLVFRNADFSEWLGELVKQILFLGFFLALLTNSAAWAGAIVNSFRQAATSAAQANGVAAGMAPSDIFDVGMQVAGTFVSATSLWSPTASLGLLLAALVVIICFAMITAFMIAALVESYVVISASVLFMGFGGSRWTKDFAVKILVYAVSVGAKLFILQLLIAIGAQIFRQLATNVQTSNESLFVIIGSAIVMLAITRTVPDLIQGLINGTSLGSGGAMASTAGAAVAGTAIGAVGGGMLARGAGSLANAQSEQGRQDGKGAARRAAGWAVNFGRNVAGGLAANISDRLSGRAAHHGTRMAQTGQNLSQEADALRTAQERNRRQPGNTPGNQSNGGNT